ncbi:olfactory receptor 12D2-like [Manis javanica]|uniref:olfactory receptor 12D2-like n=1 Tax=Manis javanica TaxID=9974 RepID=UPI003C6D1BD9|nr:Olfactory receptor 5V1 [Manis javanica]
MDSYNLTTVTHFILTGLSDLPEVHCPPFVVFAVTYQVTLVENGAILLVIGTEKNTTMYYFLANLFILDIFCPSATVPKMLDNLLTGNHSISFLGCVLQLYFLVALAGTEVFLLAVMAYDQYMVIFFPLRYTLIMTKARCAQLAAGTWTAGFLHSLLHTVPTFRLSFCKSNPVNQYHCDISPVVALFCSSTYIEEMLMFVVSIILGIGAFLTTFISYVNHIHLPKDPNSEREAQSLLHMCLPPPGDWVVLWHSNIYLCLAFLQSTLPSQGQAHRHALRGYHPNAKTQDLQLEEHRGERGTRQGLMSLSMFTVTVTVK